MKTNLFKQLALSGMLVLSLAACQKNSDSSKSDNSPAPAPASKPVSNAEALANAETGLAAVGLKFNEPVIENDADLHLIKATFDLKYYREFLREQKKAGIKPSTEVTLEALKVYLSAAEKYMQEDLALAVDTESQENESAEDIAKLKDRAVLQSRIDLVQARVEKLEKRLGQNQENQQQQNQQQQQQGQTQSQDPETQDSTPRVPEE